MEDKIDALLSQIDCNHMEQLLSLDMANLGPEPLLTLQTPPLEQAQFVAPPSSQPHPLPCK